MKGFVTIILGAVVFQIIDARLLSLRRKPFMYKPQSDLGEPLILTPYLEEGRIEEARHDAEVHLTTFQNVTSYSGYFTVDKKGNGNLFFWFFPSENNYAEDPVLLWVEGGPGGSGLLGMFIQHGPFIVNDNGNITLRNFSWNKNHSVLYIDQPVGTGFSFTDGDLVTNQTQMAEYLYDALIQFFTLFPELQKNEFFISGESYGGKYVPSIGYAIHQKNTDASLKINLQGLLIGAGLSDPVNQMKYGDLLYQTGLIDLPTLNLFHDIEATIIQYINEEKYYNASDSYNVLSGYMDQFCAISVYNFLHEADDIPLSWQDFVTQDDVRQAIHVGSVPFIWENLTVYGALHEDMTKSVAPWVSELLSHYRVLIFNGNVDLIVGYSLTANYLQHLNFSAAEEYKTAQRNIWRLGDKVAGYIKIAGNLTEVMVRNAGHFIAKDQPEFSYYLIYNFIRNNPIVKN